MSVNVAAMWSPCGLRTVRRSKSPAESDFGAIC